MSNWYKDIAPGFEALLHEFVYDKASLSPQGRASREAKLFDMWKQQYAKTPSTRTAYKIVRELARTQFNNQHENKQPKSQENQEYVWGKA